MRLAMPFRRPFAALEEGLREAGCEIDRQWRKQKVDAVVVDFCDAVRWPMRTWQLRCGIGRATPLLAIARDAPWHKGLRRSRLWLNERLKPFDIYATHSMQQAERQGRQALYLPNAARISEYGLGARTLASLREVSACRYQVSFIGNVDAERYPEHRPRLEFLRALKERLGREKISLSLIDSARGLPVAEQIDIIQSSLINLSHGAACDRGGEVSWGLPERCYGIPACGGFLLSDRRRHAADDFIPEREWADYADLESCVAQIKRYLARPDEARRVAEAAHACVMRRHTYRHRAQTLIDSIAQWKS